MCAQATKIIEIGPDYAPLARRIIRQSVLAYYSKFMGVRHILRDLRIWLRRDIQICTASPRGIVLLAMRGSKPVAVLTALWHITSLEIRDIFVLRGYTSQGIGKLLFDTIRDEANKRHISLTLTAMSANRSARKFYEREGGILYRHRCTNWGQVVDYKWEHV
jgi:GNAT superfamily N-acetyltransferase